MCPQIFVIFSTVCQCQTAHCDTSSQFSSLFKWEFCMGQLGHSYKKKDGVLSNGDGGYPAWCISVLHICAVITVSNIS